MFTDTPGTGNHDPDCRCRNIHTLIKHFTGDQYRVFSGTETVEKIFSFCGFGMMSQHRKDKFSADFVGGIIVRGKNNRAFAGMPEQDLGDGIQFGFAGTGDPPLGQKCLKRLFAARITG